jgi:rod shape determining protein RodA
LLVVLVAGRNVNGSRSFLVLGPIQIQPAEMVKFFTALALAKFLSAVETNYLDKKNRLITMAIALLPAVIILLQKETGVALVYFSFFIAMYREGLPNWILLLGFGLIFLTVATLMLSPTTFTILIAIIALLAIYSNRKKIKKRKSYLINIAGIAAVAILFSQLLVPLTFTKILKPYQVERIYTMIGQEVPKVYAQGKDVTRETAAEYNVRQSKIAIASGGFIGKGFLNGEQTKNDWVPEQRTDFIFCSVAEQFGFIGSMVLVILYMCLILRISYIAERQRSKFSRVFAYGLAGILFFHVLINLGMTIGIAPVIGIPLPLVSYGGTSLLTFTIMIFVLVRLDADRSMILR